MIIIAVIRIEIIKEVRKKHTESQTNVIIDEHHIIYLFIFFLLKVLYYNFVLPNKLRFCYLELKHRKKTTQ